jgi:uncharacterized protein (TIGR02246 family)
MRARVAFVIGIACLVPRLHAAVPDFSGSWTIDPSRGTSAGGGLGGGTGGGGGLGIGASADALTIAQDPSKVVVTERRGMEIARITYRLDGQATSNVIAAGRNAGSMAVYASRWDGSRLVTTIKAPAEPDSRDTTEYQEVRWLNHQGAMVVDVTLPGRVNARHVVYVKQARPPADAASDSNERSVRDFLTTYNDAVRRMDANALASMYTSDGEMWNAGQRVCQGQDAIRTFLKSFDGRVRIESQETTIGTIDLTGTGATVVATYRQRARMLDIGDLVEARGRIRFELVRADATHWRIKRAETTPGS